MTDGTVPPSAERALGARDEPELGRRRADRDRPGDVEASPDACTDWAPWWRECDCRSEG